MAEINWEQIFNYYNSIKSLYIESEETDPELKTNLQPLNEFRAALDHLMRLVAIEKLDCYQEQDSSEQADKLLSHLRRAFYDISDMLSMNYRNKIIDLLEPYSSEVISKALPEYYSKMKPDIEEMSLEIAKLRADKKFNKVSELEQLEKYKSIVTKLRDYYRTILKTAPSLNELHKEFTSNKKANRNDKIVSIAIAVAGIVIGVITAIVGWVL